MGSNINDALDDYEREIYEVIHLSYSNLIREINNALNKILTTTLLAAENLEQCVAKGLFKFKQSCVSAKDSKIEQRFVGHSVKEMSDSVKEVMKIEEPEMNCKLVNVEKERFDSGFQDLELVGKLENDHNFDNSTQKNNDILLSNVNYISRQKQGNEGFLPKNSSRYQCPECEYTTPHNRQNRLKIHIKGVHRKIKDFTCTQCEYGSAKKENLIRHMETKHSVN